MGPLRLFERGQRELLRYRASLAKIQTGVKNRIHAILAKNNITYSLATSWKEGKAFLFDLSLCETFRMALDGYLSVLEELEQQINKYN